MVAVLLFIAVSGSFKSMMIGQITDSMLGHLQVHRKGYVASIDSLPLNLNINDKQLAEGRRRSSSAEPAVEAFHRAQVRRPCSAISPRPPASASTASIPAEEFKTMPLLPGRIAERRKARTLLAKGEILVPELLAKGMKVKVGRHGRAGGHQPGRLGQRQDLRGPRHSGRCYRPGRPRRLHPYRRCAELLRMDGAGISEIAVRLKDIASLPAG